MDMIHVSTDLDICLIFLWYLSTSIFFIPVSFATDFSTFHMQQQECFRSFIHSLVARHLTKRWSSLDMRSFQSLFDCSTVTQLCGGMEIPCQVMFSCSRRASLNRLKDFFIKGLMLFNSKKCKLMLMNKNSSFRSHQKPWSMHTLV